MKKPLLFALSKLISGLLLAGYGTYELHRDEYLYLDYGHHLAWGYLEVPPLTALQSWLTLALGGGFFWVKLWPLLWGSLTITHPYARELGTTITWVLTLLPPWWPALLPRSARRWLSGRIIWPRNYPALEKIQTLLEPSILNRKKLVKHLAYSSSTPSSLRCPSSRTVA